MMWQRSLSVALSITAVVVVSGPTCKACSSYSHEQTQTRMTTSRRLCISSLAVKGQTQLPPYMLPRIGLTTLGMRPSG